MCVTSVKQNSPWEWKIFKQVPETELSVSSISGSLFVLDASSSVSITLVGVLCL
jgi:hypothetical protein